MVCPCTKSKIGKVRIKILIFPPIKVLRLWDLRKRGIFLITGKRFFSDIKKIQYQTRIIIEIFVLLAINI